MKNTLVLKTFLGPLRLNWSEKGLEHIHIDLNASPTDRPEALPLWLQDFLRELQAYLQAGRPLPTPQGRPQCRSRHEPQYIADSDPLSSRSAGRR
jgi:hypothetical protein